MLRLMSDEYQEAYRRVKADIDANKIDPGRYVSEFDIVTGLLAKDYVEEATAAICRLFPNVRFKVHAVRNEFFGENITVAGLLTGQDIINQLSEKNLSKDLLIPECMMKADEAIFLDNVTVSGLEGALQVKVHIVKSNGLDLVNFILKEKFYE